MKHHKVLHVVRHAKSSWDYDGIADIDRTLKSKGIRNAYEISRKIKLSQPSPQLIISSPAIRALHTAVIFARVLEFPLKKLEINTLLYESSAEKIIELIRKSPEDITSVMIFGHNPDLTDLVNYFLKQPLMDIPTSGAVILKFKTTNWKEISHESRDSEFLYFPSREE